LPKRPIAFPDRHPRSPKIMPSPLLIDPFSFPSFHSPKALFKDPALPGRGSRLLRPRSQFLHGFRKAHKPRGIAPVFRFGSIQNFPATCPSATCLKDAAWGLWGGPVFFLKKPKTRIRIGAHRGGARRGFFPRQTRRSCDWERVSRRCFNQVWRGPLRPAQRICPNRSPPIGNGRLSRVR